MVAVKPIITTAVALYVVVIKSLCIPCYAANIAAAVTPTQKKHDHFSWSCFFVSISLRFDDPDRWQEKWQTKPSTL